MGNQCTQFEAFSFSHSKDITGGGVLKFTRSSVLQMQRHMPQIRNIALEKACNRGMAFKGTHYKFTIAVIR